MLIRKPFFLSHRDRNLASRQVEVSRFMPGSLSQTECFKKEEKHSIVAGEMGGEGASEIANNRIC